MPVFKRPATSHQRSATLQEQSATADPVEEMAIDVKNSHTSDPQLRQYFAPKVAALNDISNSRRRASTGIPNPIRRVYPDRRYTPILTIARSAIQPARIEMDERSSGEESRGQITKVTVAPSVASSPLPAHPPFFEAGQPPKRSFSIGDLLSTGPQPLWRRPSQKQSSKSSGSKIARRGRSRVVSAPQAAMGSNLSRGNIAGDSEPPTKRREVTDPQVAHRRIYSSSSSQNTQADVKHEIDLNLISRTPPTPSTAFEGSPNIEGADREQQNAAIRTQPLPSADSYSTSNRPARVSAAQSEITSTIGSDSESPSIGDASTDYQSDAVYDSYPTRTTRSSSGRRGPHIESIFDDSPPPNFSSGRSTRLKDLLHDGAYVAGEHSNRYRHSTIEEEESIVSTPVRSLHSHSVTSTPSARPGAQQLFTSSPPVMEIMPDADEIDWDAFDEDSHDNGLGIQQTGAEDFGRLSERPLPFRFGPALHHNSHASTPQRTNGDKANLFEWAEVQPSPSHNQSPPRPKTAVQGKKDPDNRGSRAAGRRAPSGMHARSHSVPVVPDADGKRSSAVANKFGTWGVGSKAVTEDWNEDFDFEETAAPAAESLMLDEKRIDSGHEMFVPRSIREQQDNVVANISLLREWGLLIEELKELRIRAVGLDMMKGPYASAWHEVDAMIELADQESEEQTLEPRRSPPSSPGFDYDDFDEPVPSTASTAVPYTPLAKLSEAALLEDEVTTTFTRTSPSPAAPAHGRPRKDSEAVARTVIEALQSKRSVSDSALQPPPPAKKVPFDTATLRHIVPYVNGLKRKVKDALRETEGLYSSPRRRVSPNDAAQTQPAHEPAFRSIFDEPDAAMAAALRRSRREQAATDHDGFDDPWTDQPSDITSRLQNMRLPQ